MRPVTWLPATLGMAEPTQLPPGTDLAVSLLSNLIFTWKLACIEACYSLVKFG